MYSIASEYPWIGAAGAEVMFALTGSTLGPLAGAGIAVCCYLAGLMIVRRSSARTRAGAHAITARSTSQAGSLIRRLTDELAEADAGLRTGQLDPVAHELIWSDAWQQAKSPITRPGAASKGALS